MKGIESHRLVRVTLALGRFSRSCRSASSLMCLGSVTVRKTGLSYDWRHSGQVRRPGGSLSRVNLQTAGPEDLIMVMEVEFNWHTYDEKNVARLDTSATSVDSLRYFEDMERVVR